MKILHVAPSVARAFGGPTYSLAGFVNAATGAGASVVIAAPRPSVEDGIWLADQLPGVRMELFESFGRNAFVASPALHRWLGKNAESFDVVHVHGLLNSISSFAARRCVRTGQPVVIRPFGTLSGYTVAHRRSALKKLYFATVERPTLRRVSAMHFTTEMEKSESRAHGIDWGARAFVIPPPMNEHGHSASRHFRTSSNVVVIARLNPVKRIELLLDAWPDVVARVPEARLVIAGAGARDYELSLRRRSPLTGTSVTFAGAVHGERKRALLEEGDLFVLPSRHENFGIAVLEALTAGLPVVVTPEVQLASFVLAHQLGLVSEGTREGLADAIVSALANRELRERCRETGAQIVSQNFSPSLIGSELLGMYRFAVAAPPR
ncbi:MAG: glycosyltransferase [Gemmatimonadaceae bacterium]